MDSHCGAVGLRRAAVRIAMEQSAIQNFVQQLATMPPEDQAIFESFVRHIQKLIVADRKIVLDAMSLLERRIAELEQQHDYYP